MALCFQFVFLRRSRSLSCQTVHALTVSPSKLFRHHPGILWNQSGDRNSIFDELKT